MGRATGMGRVRLATGLAVVGLLVGSGTLPAQDQPPPEPTARELAVAWAPVVVHDLEPGRHRLQYMTRFDYDGDWQATNNIDNAETSDLPANAYYWVSQTSSHAFVGYGLYHIAGIQEGTQYENDMLGVVVVVERSFAVDHPAGRFVALITMAQATVRAGAERDTETADPEVAAIWRARTAPSRGVTAKEGVVVDDVDFVVDDRGVHPVVYAAANGAALAATADLEGRPRYFEEGEVLDWRDREWGTKVYPDKQRGRGRFLKLEQDGVVFHYQGQAQVTIDAKTKGRGRFPHHWEVVGYELLPLDQLWQLRDDYKKGQQTFEDDGVFAGSGPRGPGARAPWGWTGPPGLVLQDPATMVLEYLDGLGGLKEGPVTKHLE